MDPNPPPPTPAPDPTPASGLNPIRGNPYWKAGAGLLLANVIPGIILYALVASIIGEDMLEGPNGPTWLGAALVYLPMALGLTLILFGRPLSRSPLSLARPLVPFALAAVGVIGTVVGALTIGDAAEGGTSAQGCCCYSVL